MIAAIVGGGLKAFGMEIPLVNSNKRQILLGLFGAGLFGLSFLPADSLRLAGKPDDPSKSKPVAQ